MFEKLDVLTLLRERAVELNDNNLTNLPDEHKNTSLESGARCDLSNHQGYRDGIQSILSIIRIDYELEREAMEDESDAMYLDHLRDRCRDEFSKEGLMTDVSHMTREECITFLREKGVWNK